MWLEEVILSYLILPKLDGTNPTIQKKQPRSMEITEEEVKYLENFYKAPTDSIESELKHVLKNLYFTVYRDKTNPNILLTYHFDSDSKKILNIRIENNVDDALETKG